MKPNKENESWNEEDAVWRLLEKAEPKQASGRFADDVLRKVRLLPDADPVWPRILNFSPWLAAAACVLLVTSIFMNSLNNQPIEAPTVVDRDAQWEQIEDVAEAELLAAAAEHLDEFSDQDLVTMVGF